MDIVVTDASAIMQDDLSFDSFSQLGKLTVYSSSTSDELIDRCKSANAIIINKSIIDRAVIEALPSLKYIGVTATGYNVVDIKAAEEHGIAVTNVPAYSSDAVAQMVLSHILAFSNHVELYSNEVREGRWSRSREFCYISQPLTELAGKVLGIYGLGEIGMKTALLGKAFGMEIIYNARNRKSAADELGYRYVSVDELFFESDFLSLNAPLNSESRHIVNARTLSLMKRSAYLINTARGGLVDEESLYNALKDNRISGAGLDVLAEEPPRADNPLFTLSNCNITPHVAWGAVETRKRLLGVVLENLKAFQEGRFLNRIV